MKKTYIKPNAKAVHLYYAHALLSGSTFTEEANGKRGLSRGAGSIWDDEDEETENSMWK